MGENSTPIWLRPERAATGRPAEHSRSDLTAAALALADRDGLDAVSMRNVAVSLGTGAATLYRHVSGREDLLDLMIDATAAEYRLSPPSGDELGDLLEVAEQTYAIMLRHPWLPHLAVTRPALGPHAVAVLDHVLAVLDDHPGDGRAKLEVYALLNAAAAVFALNELGAGQPTRAAAYLSHAASSGSRPRIAKLFEVAPRSDESARDRRIAALTAFLSGLLRRPRDGDRP